MAIPKTDSLPKVGITIGDAAGIGPEISLKAMSDVEVRAVCRPILIGDLAFLEKAARGLGLDIQFAGKGEKDTREVEVYDLKNLPEAFPLGVDSAVTGKASAEYIIKAVELWKAGEIDAIATGADQQESDFARRLRLSRTHRISGGTDRNLRVRYEFFRR